MSGLWRTGAKSPGFRDTALACPLPRTILRSLIAAGRLGFGSRLRIVGDDAETLANFFGSLGMDAETDAQAEVDGGCDAAIWVDLNRAPPGERSLISPAAFDRTARLVALLRPRGTLLIVSHLGRMTGGHEPACVDGHINALPGRSRLDVVPERSFLRFLRENARPAFALAAWQVPDAAIDIETWRRRQSSRFACSASCCRWAAESTPLSRAA